jgi:hypothetical protein
MCVSGVKLPHRSASLPSIFIVALRACWEVVRLTLHASVVIESFHVRSNNDYSSVGSDEVVTWFSDLQSLVPALVPIISESLGPDGELLAHVAFGDFTRWAENEFVQLPDSPRLWAFLAELERAIAADSASIRNLIQVSFVENLGAKSPLLHLLGPNLTADAAEQFPLEFETFSVDLTDEEWYMFRHGLLEWGGPARSTDESAQLLGFVEFPVVVPWLFFPIGICGSATVPHPVEGSKQTR